VSDKSKFFLVKENNSDVGDYVTDAPNHVAPFLKHIDERFVNMCKAIVTDDIQIIEDAHRKKWDPLSSKAQKFWLQSPVYRQVFNYAVFGTMTGSSAAISYMVTKLGSTYTTIQKIVNEGEAEGYIDVYNKGDAKSKTTIAAKPWLALDYMQRYCVSRAEGWNSVLNDFDTNNFHIWYESMKANPKKAESFAKSFKDAMEKAKMKEGYGEWEL